MKNFLILFIILVSLMTFAFMRSKKINENNVIAEIDIEGYKNSLKDTYEKVGYPITNEELDSKAQKYKEAMISAEKTKTEGMSFPDALKRSLIISLIISIALHLIYFVKNIYFNELFGSSFGNDDQNNKMKGWMRFFFGKMR